MSNKHKSNLGGLVYSTNPNLIQPTPMEEQVLLPKNLQRLKIKLDSKQRAGKLVTLIEGFEGPEKDLEELGKLLKTKCGTGGTVKDGLILIQGDYKEKILKWLKDLGYVLSK
jgi:translation initiation factor 1